MSITAEMNKLVKFGCQVLKQISLEINIAFATFLITVFAFFYPSLSCQAKKVIEKARYQSAPEQFTIALLIKINNVHPRMYMTAESREVLKAKMTSQPYAAMLVKELALADKAVAKGYPIYKTGSGYDEQLWQREVGNAIPELAMAYTITGIKKYFDTAKDYMLAAASYPTWGIGDIDNTDLATGHLLFGMSIGYDWLYNDLDVNSRDSIRNCLIRRGGRLYDILSTGKVWWHKSYLHNHQHCTMGGLAAAGFALYGETPEADKWLIISLEKFKIAINSHPTDGGWHEGIPYSGYGIEYMMKIMGLTQDLLGVNLFKDSKFFQNIANFRINAMIPMDYWKDSKSTLMSLGDAPRTDWYGPDYLLRKLASEYNDGYAQWLADKLDSAGMSSPQAFFLNLLWVNPSVKPKSPTAFPLFRHYNDLDITYMRSGWDGKESVSMFKCGPHLGHSVMKNYSYDPYGGHNHPDVGTFQIFSHGDWLITDEGYAWKRTAYQNTLVVNGKGQIGEGRWLSSQSIMGAKELPSIVYKRVGKDYDYVIGNAKPFYPSSTHLTFFYRHMLYLRPDCWVIADEVKADSTSLFEFYYHSNLPLTVDGTNRFKAEGKRGSMTMTILKPNEAATSAFLQDIDGTGGGVASRLNVLKVCSKNKTSDLFITVIESYPSGTVATIKPTIVSTKRGDTLILETTKGTKSFKLMTERKNKKSPLLIEK